MKYMVKNGWQKNFSNYYKTKLTLKRFKLYVQNSQK